MSQSDPFDRYRTDESVLGLVTSYRALAALLAFLVATSLVAVAVSYAGYSEVSAMILAWDVLVTGVFFVFAVVPLYAIRLLPDYHKF